MSDRDDELMTTPPERHAVRGVLEGDRAGRRIRGWLVLAGCVLVPAIAWLWGRAFDTVVVPSYELAPDSDNARDRVLVWSSGKARLGLSRQTPGVEAIVLPDRVVRLALGCEHAQIRVDVRDGETVAFDVVVGDIVTELREATQSD